MPSARRAHPVPAWLLPLCLALLCAGQIYAFRWGVPTLDTIAQWEQARTGRYDDWHPPATAWLWRRLMPLGPGTAPVLVFDCALYWAGVGLLAEALRRRGQPWAMAAVVLAAATPIPLGQFGSILKDPLLAACCLPAAGLIAFRRRSITAAAGCALLLFATAVRVNAVFATAPLLVVLLPPRWTDRPARLVPALAAAAILLAAGGQLIDRVILRPHESHPVWSLVNFDLAGIAAHGGGAAYPNLTPAQTLWVVESCYDARQFNPAFGAPCDGVEDALFAFAAARRSSAIDIWLRAIAAAPGAWLRHRLAHFNWNMRLFVPAVPDDAIYIMSQPNAFGLRFVPGPAAMAIYHGARIMALSPPGRPATWLAVALGLLITGWRLPSRRLVLALAGSAAAYGGAYAVVSVAPDLRYNLWTMLAAAMALIVTAADWARDPACRPSRQRALAAAMPAMLAVTAELAGLLPA